MTSVHNATNTTYRPHECLQQPPVMSRAGDFEPLHPGVAGVQCRQAAVELTGPRTIEQVWAYPENKHGFCSLTPCGAIPLLPSLLWEFRKWFSGLSCCHVCLCVCVCLYVCVCVRSDDALIITLGQGSLT